MDSIGVLREVAERDSEDGCITDVLQTAARLIGDDLCDLPKELLGACDAAPGNLAAVCQHIISTGGKQVRPLLCLLSFRACNGTGALPIDLAAACELLHNATLLHDDVIDEGDVRRGVPTARIRYSNALSVLGGDFLLVQTVARVAVHEPAFMSAFLATMQQIVEGELTQLLRRGSVETTEEEYFRIIEGKTASLFRWSVLSGAMAAGASPRDREAIAEFGRHVGIAFQLMDDILDFTADPQTLGKSLLADIREGKMTLPVILATQKSPELKQIMSLPSQESARAFVPEIAERISAAVRSLGTDEQVRAIAADHTTRALKSLSDAHDVSEEITNIIRELSLSLLRRDF